MSRPLQTPPGHSGKQSAFNPFFTPATAATSHATILRPLLLQLSLNTPSTPLPQDLCTGFSLLECSLPALYMTRSFSSLLKTFPDNSI